MKADFWSSLKTLSLWTGLALLCAFSSLAGFNLFTEASDEWLAFFQSFTGGAILMMISNFMIPEAYEHGKKWQVWPMHLVLLFQCLSSYWKKCIGEQCKCLKTQTSGMQILSNHYGGFTMNTVIET